VVKNNDRNGRIGEGEKREKNITQIQSTVEVNVTLSKKDVFWANFTMIYERPWMWILYLFMIFLIMCLIISSGNIPEGSSKDFCLAVGFAFIVVLAWFIFLLQRSTIYQWEISPCFLHPCKITVSGEIVTVETEKQIVYYRLDRLSKVWELKHYFFFAQSREDYFVIPRHLLSVDEKESVRAMIEKHVNVKNRILRKDNFCSHSTMRLFWEALLQDRRGAYILTWKTKSIN